MTVNRRKLVVAVVLAFLGLTLCAGYSLGEDTLSVYGTVTGTITSGTAFSIWLNITNKHQDPIKFDRVTLTYFNPDMTFSAPVEGVISGTTLSPGQNITRYVSCTVVTSQPPGTIVPILVSLFEKRLSVDPVNYRGGVLLGAKVGP
jgi:hypothetical protein